MRRLLATFSVAVVSWLMLLAAMALIVEAADAATRTEARKAAMRFVQRQATDHWRIGACSLAPPGSGWQCCAHEWMDVLYDGQPGELGTEYRVVVAKRRAKIWDIDCQGWPGVQL